jgi:hypothetical protein
MAITTQIINGGNSLTSTSAARYNPPFGETTGNTAKAGSQGIVSTPGTIKNLRVELSAAPGTGGSGKKYDITLYKNGVVQLLTVSIFETATTGTDLSNQIAVIAGDLITIEVKPTNTPTAVRATWVMDFVPTTSGETLLLSASGSDSVVANNYFIAPITLFAGGSVTEFNEELIIPCSGTIKNLYINSSLAAGSGKSLIFTVRKNNAGQTVTTTLSGASQKSNNDTSHNFTVAAGDRICIQMTGDSTASPRIETGLTFIPDTAGNFILGYISGGTNWGTTTATNYASISITTSFSTSETTTDQLFSVFTIKNLYARLNIAPGSGGSFTFTLRKNVSSQGLSVVISGTATVGNTSADISISTNDLLDTLVVKTETPNGIKTQISYLGYIAPTSVTYQEEINSDVHFKLVGAQKTLTSDIEFTGTERKYLNSDVHFKLVGAQKTISSDVEFVNRIQKTITSDVRFTVKYDGKFIHDVDAFIVTDTNPAQIIKIDLSNPTSYTKYTITGKQNAKDLVINHDREFIYVSLDNGKVVKVETVNPANQNIFDVGENEQLVSISHSPTYLTTFIADTNVDESLFVIDEATYGIINTPEAFPLLSSLRTRRLLTRIINTILNTLKGLIINTPEAFPLLSSLRTRKVIKDTINTDLRFLKTEYDKITYTNPIARTDFHVKIDGVELTDNDLILSSIKVAHTASNKSTASFTLTRKHDDIDNPVEISNNNIVTIFIKDLLQFTGRTQKLNCSSSEETIGVFCESEEINKDYNIVTKDLPLTNLNEQIHLYDILLNDITIDNSPTQGAGEYKGVMINLGKKITERSELWFTQHNVETTAEKLEDGTFKFIPGYTYFWQVNVNLFNLEGDCSPIGWVYIGTSLAPLSSDLYEIVGADYVYQLILPDLEENMYAIGDNYYKIGFPPYKEFSAKNGKKITHVIWEDRKDGIYEVQGTSYDYENYCKIIASIEFERIKNINGDTLPRTSANIDLTIDGYLYYGLKLLTRLNIVNTTTPDIYKNSKGFPISIKQINIDSGTMKISLSCDNVKSSWELERLYQYPDEPSEVEGWEKLMHKKYDLPNQEEIDE